MRNKTLKAVTILVGATIGAGIYGIPYAINQVGFIAGLFYLLIIGLIIHLLHLLYGEVILRTKGEHQLAGYGEIYLGKAGKILGITSLFTGIYGALLAYTIKTGEFVALITNQPHPVLFSLLFFFLASVVIFIGYKTVSVMNVVLFFLMVGLIVFISLIGLPRLSFSNIGAQSLGVSGIFLPYGVILFALSGSAAVPEAEKTLREEPKSLEKALFWGTIIPIVIYLLFSLIIIGICGQKTSTDAITGLKYFLPGWVVNLGAGLGIITMSTAFLSLGYILKKVWQWDFGLSRTMAFILAVFPALFLFLFGSKNFLGVLDFAGALTGGLTGILIILLFMKAKKFGQRQPAYSLSIPPVLLWTLFGVFTLGLLFPFLTTR